VINPAVDDLAELTSVKKAYEVLGRARGSHYRAKQPSVYGPAPKRPGPSNALTEAEQTQLLEVLTSERFCDKSVAQTWATLLDEGTYLCSMSTMHRLLRAHDAAGERRRQATHPAKKKPELLATRIIA
jgi:putative transposase